MVSKVEELNALNKIRRIVEDLGPDSYLAATFKGCFELGESNIKNDFCLSYYDKVEDLTKAYNEMKCASLKLSHELTEAQELCSKYSDELAEMIAERKEHEDALTAKLAKRKIPDSSLDYILNMLRARISELSDQNSCLAANFESGLYEHIEGVTAAYEEVRRNKHEIETIINVMKDIAKSQE